MNWLHLGMLIPLSKKKLEKAIIYIVEIKNIKIGD